MSLDHPLAPRGAGGSGACPTRSFPFCFANSRERISRTYSSVFIYLFIHSAGRGGGRKPTILMRNYLTLSCRIRYCMTQRFFRSTFLKTSCQIKTAEKEKTETDFRQVSPAQIWGGLSGVSAFFPLRNPVSLSLPAVRRHPAAPRAAGPSLSPVVQAARGGFCQRSWGFKRVGKGILERDDIFQQRPYPALGGEKGTDFWDIISGRGALTGLSLEWKRRFREF